MNKKVNVKKMTMLSLFSAIVVLLSFTPLGFIPISPVSNATTVHIPVIIGGIILGPTAGLVLGFVFGICSYINNFYHPSILAFAFYNPIITFVPRLLIGPAAYYCFVLFKKLKLGNLISSAIAGFFGSMVNTVFVLYFIYLFERTNFAKVANVAVDLVGGVLMGVVVSNGIPEAIVATIIVAAVTTALISVSKKYIKDQLQ